MKIYNTEGVLIPDVKDVLCELGNAGTGLVSVTIGRMLNIRIDIETPKVTYVESGADSVLSMDTSNDSIAIFMHMTEAINGSVVFIIEHDFIVTAVEKLTGKHYSFEEMLEDECGFSAVKEFGNIIGSAYVKAIGGYTGIRFFLSPVMVGVDKADKLLSSAYMHPPEKNGRQIYVESRYSIMDKDGEPIGQAGHIVMMPDEDSIEKLMEAIGM